MQEKKTMNLNVTHTKEYKLIKNFENEIYTKIYTKYILNKIYTKNLFKISNYIFFFSIIFSVLF